MKYIVAHRQKMSLKSINRFFFCCSICIFYLQGIIVFARDSLIIDQIYAVVGDEIVLKSDIEKQFEQYRFQGVKEPEELLKCNIFREFLVQKMLVNQAELDSVTVSEAQVNVQLDQRINYMIESLGSAENLVRYFRKSIAELKDELRPQMYEQLVTQKMQSDITGAISVTPSDVRNYYQSLPDDSIPFIETYYQVNQIVLYPPFTEQAIYDVKDKLLLLRKRILEGEKFSTLAVLYSEDASAQQGGEIGFMARGELAPQYAEAAFKLKEGGISTIVETEFGFHIIQLIERRENKVNTRHILMRPRYSSSELLRLRTKLDSIAGLIRTNDTLSFEEAARIFSQDDDTRQNGGLMINFDAGTSKFGLDDFTPFDGYEVRRLKQGEISQPFEAKDKNGRTVFKIIQLKQKSEGHKANLKDDYDMLKKFAEQYKRQIVLNEWIAKKQKTTFIQIRGDAPACQFLKTENWIKAE